MSKKTVEQRVGRLEEALIHLTEEVTRLSVEMREFKNEVKAFKDSTEEFKQWAKRTIEDLRREIGGIANRMGRFAEDIVAPALPELVRRYFRCEIKHFAERVKRSEGNRSREIDVLIVCDSRVMITETKSTVRHSDVEKFAEFINKGEFFEMFPEYEGKELIGIFASLNIPEKEVRYLTKNGIYAMRMKGAYMDLVNFEEIKR